MKRLLFLFLLLPALASAYQDSPRAVIETAMNNIRTEQYTAVDESVLFEPSHHAEVLQVLSGYYADSLSMVRDRAYHYTRRVGQASDVAAVRAQAVAQLITGMSDADGIVVNTVLSGLGGFSFGDFSESQKSTIAGYLQTSLPHYDKLLRLAGFLQLEDQAALIRAKAYDRGESRAVRWAAKMAMARLGDEAILNSIITKLESVAINEDIVYEIFPDLIYTRQPAAIEFMVSVLNSEERNCYPANPDATQKIPCGYRVMEFFPGVIEDFPLQRGASGDIETDDYREALQTAREWFKINSGNYTINKSTM